MTRARRHQAPVCCQWEPNSGCRRKSPHWTHEATGSPRGQADRKDKSEPPCRPLKTGLQPPHTCEPQSGAVRLQQVLWAKRREAFCVPCAEGAQQRP